MGDIGPIRRRIEVLPTTAPVLPARPEPTPVPPATPVPSVPEPEPVEEPV